MYAPQKSPLLPIYIAQEARDVGWELAPLADLRSLLPSSSRTECFFVGWPEDVPAAAILRVALATRDRETIEEHYRREMVAAVELQIDNPYSADKEDISSWEGMGIAAGLLTRMRRARSRYTFRTAASRNDLSSELQTNLWVLLGVLTNGVCEDPQEGEIVDASKDE